ncbi:MAG: alpha/beta fold hydrolase [Cyanobacteria bacterium Co-bin8]|nr:alpha/beta fold hydrolase [Cyanobacteria bacterium Co-bin8]
MAAVISGDSFAEAPLENTTWYWRQQAVNYVRAGSNHPNRPPLLLIHGFGASTDHWRKNVVDLQADFEVYAIDMLGFGRSAKPAWEYGGSLWQAQLHDFITEVIGRPAVLAGNSLGGYAALCVAANHPESAAGVVLLNSAGPFAETNDQAQEGSFRSAVTKAVQGFMLQPAPSWMLFQYVRQRSTIRRTLEQVYVDKSAITERLIDEISRPANDPGAVQVFASVFKAPRGETISTLLSKMNCPLLLLWGEYDPWMNSRLRSSQFRQHYTNLKEHFLHAGHCPHDEVPDQVNALMRDWVLSLSH